MHWHLGLICPLFVIGLWAAAAIGADPTVPTTLQSRLESRDATNTTLPGITIDRQEQTIDLDATVNLREGRWLELLACTPNTRTHESIFVISAKPSHVHLALQMLGLNPGAPMKWRSVDGQYELEPAHGPQITVSVIFDQDGHRITVPAHQWVVNKKTNQTLADPLWIFTGSSFDSSLDPPVYRADIEGSVLSLVHFGDEVLARNTSTTHQSDEGQLQPRTDQIPKIGTHVKIRLRPVE